MSMDYKAKYLELRAKLIESTDLAYRLGHEAGFKEGQNAGQMQMQQQQMGMDPNAQQPGQQPGRQPQIVNGQENKFAMDVDNSPALNMDGGGGSELDQHINELEGLVQKGEKPSYVEIRNVVTKISDLRKNQKDMVKNANESVAWQKSIIDNLMKSMDKKTETAMEQLEVIIKENDGGTE